jgi:hypothetical protein
MTRSDDVAHAGSFQIAALNAISPNVVENVATLLNQPRNDSDALNQKQGRGNLYDHAIDPLKKAAGALCGLPGQKFSVSRM